MMAESTTKPTTKKAAPKASVVAEAKPAAKTVAKATPKEGAAKSAKSVVPTAKKPVASKAPAAKKVVAKNAQPTLKAAARLQGKIVVSDEQRYRMVAEAAYYRAESNQFKSDPLRDWIEAEKDINALLSGAH